MTSVSENLCSAVAQWSFTAPPIAPPIANGNYLITFGTMSGKCMVLDSNSNVNMSSSNCPTGYWYVTTSVDPQSNTYYYINWVANGVETAKGMMLTILPNGDCNTQTQLVYSNDSSQASALPIQLNTDNTVFNNQCGTYYVPSSDGSAIVITDPNDPNRTQWSFTPVNCPAPTALPTGVYSISFKDNNNTTQYLTLTTGDKTYGNVITYTPTFNLSTCSWKYDATAKTLSTGCSATPYYLYFDPDNPFWAVLTTTASQASTDIVLTSNGIFVGTYQALVPAISGPYVMVHSCLSPVATKWTTTSLSSPAPTGGPASGAYIIKYNGQCLTVDGSNNVVLQTCPTTPTVWTYSTENSTLSYKGQCLLNPSTSCSSFSNLILGACTDANAKRFVLGPSSMYDPVLGFCYGEAGASAVPGVFGDCSSAPRKSRSSSECCKWKDWVVILSILLAAAIVGAIIFWSTRRSVQVPKVRRSRG